MSSSSIFASVVITLIIVGIVLFILILSLKKNPEYIYGTFFRIQQGVTSGTTDTFNTSLYDIYIGNSSSALKLTIAASPNNIVGREIIVRNNTDNLITLIDGDGVSIIKSNKLTNIVATVSTLVVVVKPNNFIRIS